MLDPNDPRTGRRVARLLGFAAMACLLAAAVSPARAVGTTRSFKCAHGKAFTARLSEQAARVDTGSTKLLLPRKASSIGTKFGSPSATLIIDEDFASLIGRDLQRFERCYATSSYARLR
jgi:hypothetical protein